MCGPKPLQSFCDRRYPIPFHKISGLRYFETPSFIAFTIAFLESLNALSSTSFHSNFTFGLGGNPNQERISLVNKFRDSSLAFYKWFQFCFIHMEARKVHCILTEKELVKVLQWSGFTILKIHFKTLSSLFSIWQKLLKAVALWFVLILVLNCFWQVQESRILYLWHTRFLFLELFEGVGLSSTGQLSITLCVSLSHSHSHRELFSSSIFGWYFGSNSLLDASRSETLMGTFNSLWGFYPFS